MNKVHIPAMTAGALTLMVSRFMKRKGLFVRNTVDT
jgi:hypothetical protein